MSKEHIIKTPFVAHYSRAYERLYKKRSKIAQKQMLRSQGVKFAMVKEKSKFVQKLVNITKPFRKKVI